ncbi:MAG: DUF4325 domain-containing protein [Fibrobacterota bacterium]
MSRKGVNKYLRKLALENIIQLKPNGRSPDYRFRETRNVIHFENVPALREDDIWKNHVRPKLPPLSENVLAICQYGMTEMINNVIDHSNSKTMDLVIAYTIPKIWFWVMDDGVGIFNKIQKDSNLEDPRHAIIELAKGKLTSDPAHHSGQGIFFTSRMFNVFDIISGNLFFSGNEKTDYSVEVKQKNTGTSVFLLIQRDSTLEMKTVFDRFSDNEENDYGFTKTLVQLKRMQDEGENLVSRSQAKRLIVRFEKFKEVVLDFNGIKTIGQGFADQVFRIFKADHPLTRLSAVNTNEEIDKRIRSAQNDDTTADNTAPRSTPVLKASPTTATTVSTSSSSASVTPSSWYRPST